MPDHIDRSYYTRRAATERELERLADDKVVARIHAELAERYELIAKGEMPPFLQLIRP